MSRTSAFSCTHVLLTSRIFCLYLFFHLHVNFFFEITRCKLGAILPVPLSDHHLLWQGQMGPTGRVETANRSLGLFRWCHVTLLHSQTHPHTCTTIRTAVGGLLCCFSRAQSIIGQIMKNWGKMRRGGAGRSRREDEAGRGYADGSSL